MESVYCPGSCPASLALAPALALALFRPRDRVGLRQSNEVIAMTLGQDRGKGKGKEQPERRLLI